MHVSQSRQMHHVCLSCSQRYPHLSMQVAISVLPGPDRAFISDRSSSACHGGSSTHQQWHWKGEQHPNDTPRCLSRFTHRLMHTHVHRIHIFTYDLWCCRGTVACVVKGVWPAHLAAALQWYAHRRQEFGLDAGPALFLMASKGGRPQGLTCCRGR